MISWNAIITGLFAAGFVQLFQLLREHFFASRKERRNRARSLALAAQRLDEFAFKCARSYGVLDLAYQTNGSLGRFDQFLEFPPEPLGINYEDVPSDLLTRYLAARLYRHVANDAIFDAGDFGDSDDAIEEALRQMAIQGNAYVMLAASLRAKAKLPQPKADFESWDFRGSLAEYASSSEKPEK